VVDPKYFQSYRPFASHKTTDPGEDFLEVEDSPEAEDSLEEEDSPEEVGIQEAVGYHLEDHRVEDGDRRPSLYHKHSKENW